jgi:hypothetical protein
MTYNTHPRYRIFALVSLLLTGLFAWDLLDGLEPAIGLFAVVCCGLFLWYVRAMLTSVVLSEDRVVLHVPLSQPRAVEFRQLMTVSEEGRIAREILIMYHPTCEQGLVDLDDVRSMSLPVMVDQTSLLATLNDRVPA